MVMIAKKAGGTILPVGKHAQKSAATVRWPMLQTPMLWLPVRNILTVNQVNLWWG